MSTKMVVNYFASSGTLILLISSATKVIEYDLNKIVKIHSHENIFSISQKQRNFVRVLNSDAVPNVVYQNNPLGLKTPQK